LRKIAVKVNLAVYGGDELNQQMVLLKDTKYSLPPEDFTCFYKIESTSGKCLVLDEADKMLD
jgi:superfamily II DNA/RNA helicase